MGSFTVKFNLPAKRDLDNRAIGDIPRLAFASVDACARLMRLDLGFEGKMQVSRRAFGLGVIAALAAGPAFSYSDAGFDAWVKAFRKRALQAGVSAATFDRAFRRNGLLPEVIERDRNQIETRRSVEEYLAIAASPERLALGKKMMSKYSRTLRAIEKRYGVESHVVAAVWGLESFYGTKRGDIPVISALATLAYEGRRAAFFEKQLIAALKIVQRGDVSADKMTGSWAGAMGHTQFIPTSYQAYAVDFKGDGRRDIWSDDPTDALASTAAYLAKSGWKHGQPWGQEVLLPKGFSTKNPSPRSDWGKLGLTAADGARLVNHGTASLTRPAGNAGPAFLIYRNFSVIKRYNNSDKYAMGIGYLSDRLNGKPAFRVEFGADAQGMTLKDRQDLQRRLIAKGYDTGGTDGVIGKKSEAAIAGYQRDKGMAVTGAPSMELLRQLR